MGFSCGIVGLPNVGKSTIFNALSKGNAAAANFPFCTIEPNTGIVPVPDPRLAKIAEYQGVPNAVPTSMKFIDIAGLVKGASQGEGLGNQFLGHIRNVDAIAHIVRIFDDPDVVHVSGNIDPVSDLELVQTELMLADLEALQKKLDKTRKSIRFADAETKKELELSERFAEAFENGEVPELHTQDDHELERVRRLGLLTLIPAFICANVDEDTFRDFGGTAPTSALLEYAKSRDIEVLPVCGKLEEELTQLDPDEAQMFMEELGMTESGLDRLIHTGYKTLDYITFFTMNENETRAWTVRKGTRAPKAAGKIHSDMEKGFIRMEVISYDHLSKFSGWHNAQVAGKMRIEGKDYVIQDGDCVFVRFSV